VSEPKFTKGPWNVAGARHVYAGGPGGANICSVSDPRATSIVQYTKLSIDSKDFYEACANAHLIAGAPALYEALETASDELEYVGENFLWSYGPVATAIGESVARFRSALAQARGERA
jgi:hypothetical protein